MDVVSGRRSPPQTDFMNNLSSKLIPTLSISFSSSYKLVSLFSTTQPPDTKSKVRIRAKAVGGSVTAAKAAMLKENWLDSLSCPLPEKHFFSGNEDSTQGDNEGSGCVIGVDPDVSGALALLKSDEDSGFSAQVFDSPHLPVLVGKRVRKRLDAKSIVQLLRSLEVPAGTPAYIEQSIPFPKDGKQGWWSGGFGYGLWIGILVASGLSVVPIPSLMWKNEFKLAGGTSTKDDSRRLASQLFPSLSPRLSRKKDHGRAEALLIAAYGKGLKTLKPPVKELVC